MPCEKEECRRDAQLGEADGKKRERACRGGDEEDDEECADVEGHVVFPRLPACGTAFWAGGGWAHDSVVWCGEMARGVQVCSSIGYHFASASSKCIDTEV